MLILGLQGSPRKGGNTDTLLGAFLEKAGQAGAAVKTIQVARAGIVPCKGCGYCETHGTCVIADDPMSTELFGLLRQADLVVAATPVYFYGISAQLKVLIDRCQTLWCPFIRCPENDNQEYHGHNDFRDQSGTQGVPARGVCAIPVGRKSG